VFEQDRTVRKSLHMFQKWHSRFAAKPIEIALAPGQRKTTQIDAILVQQIECQQHQLRFVRILRAHLRHQPEEVCGAP